MTSKQELRNQVTRLALKVDELEGQLSREKTKLEQSEKERLKFHRQIQDARSAAEDLRRALYPDTYTRPFTPGILPGLPGALHPFPGPLTPQKYPLGTVTC